MKHILWLGLLAFATVPALAQEPPAAAGATGKIHGHVVNPTGAPQSGGTISLSTDAGHSSKYTFQVDQTGAYSGEAAPGTYTVVFRQKDTPPDKMVDSIENVKIEAGQDVNVDDDMSRQAFIDKLPEEQKKQLEEIRKHNSEALKANEVIKNLNNDLKQVTTDIHDADATKDKEVKKAKYTEIESLMQKDTQVRPQEPVLWAYMGSGETGLGNIDPANSKDKYEQAETAFKKTIELSAAAKSPKPDIVGMAHAGLGEIYARQGKVPEANAEYAEAAKADPAKAAMYLRNEAVIFFQSNNAQAQIAAAKEALKADPNQAVLYYIIGQGLVQNATVDPKTNKIILPPECAEAYQKYLELAPTGPYAADAQGILAQAGQKVNSSYKAGKSK
ncbi:MAG TPA: carboxypeptidase-like regulatory domain-containing protein [Terracidiphilus sp.]